MRATDFKPTALKSFVERSEATYAAGRSALDAWHQFLQAEVGAPGTISDLEKQWLRNNGGIGETHADLWRTYLQGQGYSGSLPEMMRAFFETGTAGFNPDDLEGLLAWYKADAGVMSDAAAMFSQPYAASYSGSAQMHSRSDDANFSGGDTNFYFAGWFNFDVVTGQPGLVAKWNGTGNQREYVLWRNTTSLRFEVCPDGATNISVATWSSTVTTGTWYFIECWHDATNDQIGICVNRGADVTTAHATGCFDGTADFQISAYNGLANYNDGQVDSFCFYRKIPTTTERNTLYNSGTGLRYRDVSGSLLDSLTAWYDFGDEGAALTADSHTGGLTLTQTGSPTTVTGVAGGGEWLDIADNAALSMGDINYFVAGWINSNRIGIGQTIVGKWGPAGSTAQLEYSLFMNGSNRFSFSTSNGTTQTTVTDSTFGAASANTWYFVMAYHDAANDLIGLSINGQAFQTAAHTVGTQDAGYRLGVGRNGEYTTSSFSDMMRGKLDSVCIGKSPSSSFTTIRDLLYNSGVGKVYADLTSAEKTALGLTAWWNLDEQSGTRYDSHGTNHLTDNNTVRVGDGIAASAAADSNFAAQFKNASSQYLSRSNTGLLDSQPWSIEHWFYLDSTSSTRGVWTVGNTPLEQSPRWLFRIDGTTLSLYVNGVGYRTVATGLKTGTWYHVVITVDASNNVAVYLDGSSVLTFTVGSLTGNLNNIYLGSGYNGYHDGRFDNFRIWGRVLSASDVTTLFNGGAGLQYGDLSSAMKTNMKAAWEFEDASSLGTDSHGSYTLTNNNSVTRTQGVNYSAGIVAAWQDQSGNARHMSQETHSNKPGYVTNAQNSKPTIRFDGIDDLLDATGVGTLNQPYTIFVVAKVGTSSSSQRITDSVSTASSTLMKTTGNNLQFAAGTTFSYGALDTNYHVISAVADGASTLVALDGNSSTGNAGTTGLTGLRLGASRSNDNYLNGEIAEVILYNSALSTADRQKVEAYLGDKYGISVS